MRVRGLTIALLFATATAAGAQTAGTFEITGFGRFTRFDDALQIQEGGSAGGSLGFYPIRNLAIEAEAAYTDTHSNLSGIGVSNIPLRGRLTYHFPLGGYASAMRIGIGYLRNLYRQDVSFDDNGFTGVVGFRWGLSPSLGFRVDGTADYVRSPDAGWTDEYVNWGAQVGLSLRFGASSHRDRPRSGNDEDLRPKPPAPKAAEPVVSVTTPMDADGDGVNDEADLCGGTAAGEAVDAGGCSKSQVDGDADGISNANDQCSDTPAGEPVDSAGCAESQRDTDKDGVADATDQCPNSEAAEPVDPRGCSRDSDTDGIPDGGDRCPNTPKGQPADEHGCPILFQKGARSVILRGVTFQSGKARLTPQSREVLRDIATQLVANPQFRVQISGHTDNTGSRAANLRLSLARARTVQDFLVGNGVSPKQLTSKGFGPDVPITSNKTVAGRAKNRRVELNRTN
ncbi:MAG TPA: OmpA family protein [Gemmatimonadales bacterium]